MFDLKGDRPQWQVIYDHLATLAIGDTVKDVELAGLLPDAPEASVRGAFFRAVREVEDSHKRTFARVRLVGYRMVAASEHEVLARGQHKKAKRRMGAAVRKARSADRSLLTSDERRRLDQVEEHLGRQIEMIRRLDTQQERAAARIAATEKDSMVLSDRLDALTALLERHGIGTDPAAPAK